MEYRILVNATGTVQLFRLEPSGRLRFWSYHRSIANAIEVASRFPTMIILRGSSLWKDRRFVQSADCGGL